MEYHENYTQKLRELHQSYGVRHVDHVPLFAGSASDGLSLQHLVSVSPVLYVVSYQKSTLQGKYQ